MNSTPTRRENYFIFISSPLGGRGPALYGELSTIQGKGEGDKSTRNTQYDILTTKLIGQLVDRLIGELL